MSVNKTFLTKIDELLHEAQQSQHKHKALKHIHTGYCVHIQSLLTRPYRCCTPATAQLQHLKEHLLRMNSLCPVVVHVLVISYILVIQTKGKLKTEALLDFQIQLLLVMVLN